MPPFLGRVPQDLERSHVSLLGLIALGLLFEQYDLSIINSAIKHIMFLLALVGMSVLTLATAFVMTPLQYVLAQVAARAFLFTASVLGVVILVEEFPAQHRGWGLGMLVAISAFGYGIGTGLFAAVDSLPFGWRALYAIGVTPLVLLPQFRRRLAETARFRAQSAEGAGTEGWLAPIVSLARTHPTRVAAVGTAAFLGAVGTIGVFQYLSPFVQTVHGWEPWQFSAMVIGGGFLGILGNVVAGRLSDRIGRRSVGFVAYALYPAAAYAIYHGESHSLVLAWIALTFFGTAGDVVMRALSSEVFPTSHRSTAMGFMILLQSLGWSVGLVLISAGAGTGREVASMVSVISLTLSFGAFAFLFVPESGRRELEEVAREVPRS